MSSSALSGFYIPSDLGGIWDWSYFWTVVKNFLASESGFALIAVAAVLSSLVLTYVVKAVRR